MTEPQDFPLSFSQLDTVGTCGEKYRLRYVERERIQQQPSAAAIGGTVSHALADEIDRQLLAGAAWDDLPELAAKCAADVLATEIARAIEKSPDFADITTWHTYGRKSKQWPTAQNVDWFEAVAIPAAIGNYIEWRKAADFLTIYEIPGFGPAIEYPFEIQIDGRTVRGKIDRVFQDVNTGACVVVDLKNGARPKTTTQLGVYAKGLRETTDGTYRWGAYLHNLKYENRGGAKLTTPVDLNWWTDARLGRWYAPAKQAIETGVFMPVPGDNCMHCTVAHACDFYDATFV